MIQFTAYGLARPQGSKTGFPIKRKNGTIGVAMVESSKGVKPWRGVVAMAASEVYQGDLLRGPLDLCVTFYFPRPDSHYNISQRYGRRLRPAAPGFCYPTGYGDRDKLLRAICDSIKGIIYHDDKQIVSGHTMRAWGEPARAEVKVTELTG